MQDRLNNISAPQWIMSRLRAGVKTGRIPANATRINVISTLNLRRTFPGYQDLIDCVVVAMATK